MEYRQSSTLNEFQIRHVHWWTAGETATEQNCQHKVKLLMFHQEFLVFTFSTCALCKVWIFWFWLTTDLQEIIC